MASRSRKVFIVCGVAAAHAALLGALLRPRSILARPGSPQISADLRAACGADVQALCAGVPPGGGRIIACLKQHQAEVSDGCKQAIAKAMGQSRGSGGGAIASPAPAGPTNPPPAPEAPPRVAPVDTGTTPSSPVNVPSRSHSTHSMAAGSPQRYFLMKQAQIDSHALDHPGPAYHLMIPTTWQFKDFVASGSMKGQGLKDREDGCFADFFAMGGVAKSADSSIAMQLVPQFTWQYIDDPAGQRQMQIQNQRDEQVGLQPCPVRAPVPAAEFLRQDMIAKYRKGKTVVSIDPFPELDQLVRYQLGLPPAGADGNTRGIRTDAARARLAFDDDKGQPVEEWIAAAIVVRAFPAGGRATAYDWHAIKVMFFRTPTGQLDANDRLFKLIASTVHPDPEWKKWSDGVIATMYRRKQEELAKQAQIIAQLQLNIINTLQGVTARQQAGSMQAAYGVSQGIRGVQTFRDPSTGATMELSNQYDHAWVNGTNQYVMSDDPNFNPNGNLNGNWTQLQVVRPQP